ncbi:MAG: hypothetical protein ACOYMG_19675, partial [Candidatus Methylumidiphilus sp.]
MKFKFPLRKSIDELEANANNALEQRHYKEAISFFKDLLKQEQRTQWEHGLAEAYRQRAGQVAGKGMWQEAVILWENYAKLSPQSVPSDVYLGWLAQAGQFPKLAGLLASQGPAFEQGPLGRRLSEAMAILALQNEKLVAAFPKEHPIAKHHPLIKQAISAYCAGRDGESEEALKHIPSRSPYRNVRTLLKALLLMGQDRAAGLILLERVEADSVCLGFARLLRQQGKPDGPVFSASLDLPPKQQAFIHKINGYTKAQLNLLRDAKKFAKNPDHRMVFNTLLGNRGLLGETACRRFCACLLVDFPEGMDAFQKAFGKLSAFERQRLLALHEETQGDYPQAATYWHMAAEELAKRPEQERDRLDEALIFRRIAKLADHDAPNIAIAALGDSLKLDPGDQASYVTLVRLNEKMEAPKEAQEWLENGLKHFPKDVELLTLAMNAASRRKAFKKAAGLAKTLLEIDPINSPARQLLISAHIGHARKQFRAGKFSLVQQELEQARSLDPHRRNASLCMLEGFLALLQQGQEHATKLLAEGWRLAGGDLCAQFLFNIEALSLDYSPSKVTSLSPALDKNHTANRTELLGLVKLIDRYNAEEKKHLPDALKPLKTILKRSFKQLGLTEDDYFNLGQAFARSAQFELLNECATAASRHFPSWPAATYFHVFARCKGVAKRATPKEENSLEYAVDRAHRNKDHRTAMLIENFFRELDGDRDLENDYYLPPGFEDFDPRMAPAMMKRMDEVENMPRAELIAMISKALPGMPLKNMSQQELLEMAAVMMLGELGIGLEKVLGALSPGGPAKKPPKSR